jgi:acetyl esterase/lipase
MDLLRSSGEAYAAQLTASGVKVELIEGAQHGSLNLPLRPQGAQSLKLIVGSPNSRSIGTGHLPYHSDSHIAHYHA